MSFFDITKISENLLQRKNVVWFSDIPKEKRIVNDEVKERLRTCAESWEGYVHSEYLDSYGEFDINRNRSNFENMYINRRACLADMAFFEIFIGGGKYLSRIENMARRICAEPTWCVPSHRNIKPAEVTGHSIELYAAETASVLAFVSYFLGDKLSAEVRAEISKTIDERMFFPYTESDKYGWMGVDGHKINNWNPWINSNIMFCAALVCEDEGKYRSLVLRALTLTENYVNCLGEDCLCDEGVRYWALSGACLFDISEILYDLCGGKVDLTASPAVRNACDYITGMYDEYGNPANFGDAGIDYYPQCALLVRAGERTGNTVLADMGRALYTPDTIRIYHDNFYRQLKDVYTASRIVEKKEIKYPETKLLKSINIFTVIKNRLFLSFKGNHNGEYHNHNDVGNFVVYYDGTPIFIDAGVDSYSGYTFSKDRYSLWYMRSDYHNVPTVSGKRQTEGIRFSATPLKINGMRAETDISGAYGEDVSPWIRSAEHTGDTIIITDSFKNTDGTLLNYMLKDEPRIEGNKLFFLCGVCADLEGASDLKLETVDITGFDSPDGITADAHNRKGGRSYLIPRLMTEQWKQNNLFRLTARPTGDRVMLKIFTVK
ncbi:MAG: heparinase II/III family protein [Clostridia bacterium]|nr:heparinase II/III family protein [Clostridia bacterium]